MYLLQREHEEETLETTSFVSDELRVTKRDKSISHLKNCEAQFSTIIIRLVNVLKRRAP